MKMTKTILYQLCQIALSCLKIIAFISKNIGYKGDK